MQLNNGEIIQYAENIRTAFFNQESSQYLPVRLNYAIQKNLATLVLLYNGINDSRQKILEHYGVYNEDNDQYSVDEENIEAVNAELKDLQSLVNEVNIMTVPLNSIEDLSLTAAQMNAIMFMVTEN